MGVVDLHVGPQVRTGLSGLGWVVWKDKKYLPEEMSFSVNYLGANITQVGLNFSRPAAQILGQYYNFIRLGFDGYKEVQAEFDGRSLLLP